MKAIRLKAPEKIAVENIPDPVLSPGWALIEMRHAAICGSDKRWYKVGAHKMPLTLGHELSGVVLKVADEFAKDLVGQHVSIIPLVNCGTCGTCLSGNYNLCGQYTYLGSSCDGGFAEMVVAPLQSIFPVPASVDLDGVAIIAPYTVALHALRMADYRSGQSAIVLGAGAIGLMATNYLKNFFGAMDVTVADVIPEKLEIAQELGAKTLDLKNDNISEYHADVIVVATAAPSAINTAFDMVNKHGVISVPGITYLPIEMPAKTWEKLLRREAKVVGSWNYVWHEMPENEWATTLSCLESQKINPKTLITHHYSLDQAQEAFDTAFNDPKAGVVMFDINK